VTIALVDVHYDGSTAHAACILAQSWEADSALEAHVLHIGHVEPYEPGSFYRRELPCLLSVLGLLTVRPDVVVIDGYVWLPSPQRAGLGAHLHEALGNSAAVVGIAKTAFAGVQRCVAVAQVFRGRSHRPLYVTAAGMDLELAAQCVHRMADRHRIPELVRKVDRLARAKGGLSQNAA
jgi:deoxyribonuclease V